MSLYSFSNPPKPLSPQNAVKIAQRAFHPPKQNSNRTANKRPFNGLYKWTEACRNKDHATPAKVLKEPYVQNSQFAIRPPHFPPHPAPSIMPSILSTSNNICTIHPVIRSSNCIRCAILSVTKHNSQMEMGGTSDLPTSTYPELNTDMLAGPSDPYFLAYPKMKPLSIQPQRALSVRFITRTWYPAIEDKAEHDYYPERFALSPDERVPMYAGNHYSDKFALHEEDMRDVEDLALSEAEEVPKPQRKRGRPRKCEKVYEKEKKSEGKDNENSQPMKVDEDGSHTSDCIVVEVPEDWNGNIKLKHRMDRTEIAEPRSAKKLRKEKIIDAQQIKTKPLASRRSARKTTPTRAKRSARSKVNYFEL